MMMGVMRKLATAAGLSLLAAFAMANEGGSKEVFKEGVNYLPIKPPLVVNYGGTGKVKYIKAEISLRVEDAHSAEEVTHHMPLVRDTLIMLISSVTDEQMASGEGKEKMRQEALVRLNEVLVTAIHPAASEGDHAKTDDHAKKEEHAKKEDHGKKDEHGHGDEKAKDGHQESLVSDLLFDNLVVQK